MYLSHILDIVYGSAYIYNVSGTYHTLSHLSERKTFPISVYLYIYIMYLVLITPYHIFQREKHFQYLFAKQKHERVSASCLSGAHLA